MRFGVVAALGLVALAGLVYMATRGQMRPSRPEKTVERPTATAPISERAYWQEIYSAYQDYLVRSHRLAEAPAIATAADTCRALLHRHFAQDVLEPLQSLTRRVDRIPLLPADDSPDPTRLWDLASMATASVLEIDRFSLHALTFETAGQFPANPDLPGLALEEALSEARLAAPDSVVTVWFNGHDVDAARMEAARTALVAGTVALAHEVLGELYQAPRRERLAEVTEEVDRLAAAWETVSSDPRRRSVWLALLAATDATADLQMAELAAQVRMLADIEENFADLVSRKLRRNRQEAVAALLVVAPELRGSIGLASANGFYTTVTQRSRDVLAGLDKPAPGVEVAAQRRQWRRSLAVASWYERLSDHVIAALLARESADRPALPRLLGKSWPREESYLHWRELLEFAELLRRNTSVETWNRSADRWRDPILSSLARREQVSLAGRD
jgi:hypothetical protein